MDCCKSVLEALLIVVDIVIVIALTVRLRGYFAIPGVRRQARGKRCWRK
jgi:hypothetical protein